MTDKQIIIDGVDVKGCKRRIGKDNFCRYYKRPCTENNYNCIWKKYYRKEQECEELKVCLFQVQNAAISLTKQIDQLKAENEELKKVNRHIEHNRTQKADKLMRIEKLIIACSTGYTDEFIQELLVILHEPEPIKE